MFLCLILNLVFLFGDNGVCSKQQYRPILQRLKKVFFFLIELPKLKYTYNIQTHNLLIHEAFNYAKAVLAAVYCN